jgi:hypothetical protein
MINLLLYVINVLNIYTVLENMYIIIVQTTDLARITLTVGETLT